MTNKEIQEMAKVVCNRQFEGYNLDCKKECNAKCDCGRIAEDLYNAGYRKADEVRKETAKDILQDIYDSLQGYPFDKVDEAYILELCADYGVEVDK